ncbi:putative amino-acid ABC transporter-binding protein [Apilactobacillus kunkeei]|uniref:transporter substrate-binding domain-containing protein n=1 Tax=Apilactobacillus kunkeei TaxID=148814 RepID=UPI00110CD1C2|nr:transporter substrate-binding domain-containing protein [Apilactobacillus kunkeei]MCK8629255.1 transporter substrate-binding domain-containing protein [Apilactobacillus kunkeei]MCK8634067.1 transporter substrate-binding domain-containing protein [Apilactobacillus kunkeei]TMT01724.1 transporter substrate-binding domain-containing protein [Apilactobacillus kunkeei]CAI2657389.1 putative amino-acid ABC transporter-binding protein [Apilactobacillus kunkeei]CAI2659576.1 putative amino-acid ABC tr
MKFNKLFKSLAVTLAVFGTGAILASCGNSSSSKNYKSELTNSGKLTIGLEGTYAPYSYRQDGQLKGFEVDLAKDVAKKLGLKVNFVQTKWDSLIAGLGSNRYDAVMNNMTVTPQREKLYSFSEPYAYSYYTLITKSDSKMMSIKDIKGMNIVDGAGTDNAVVAKKFGANVSSTPDNSTGYQLIQQGRADGTVNSVPAWKYFAKHNSTKGLKEIDVPTKLQAPAETSIMLNKNSKALTKKINQALTELRKDGTMKKLSMKYFGSDITTKND